MREPAIPTRSNRDRRLAGAAILLLWLILFQELTMAMTTAAAQTSSEDTGSGTPDLDRVLAETKSDSGYIPATSQEMNLSQSAFARVLNGDKDTQVVDDLFRLGFELGGARARAETLTIVRETTDRKEGKGVYAIRTHGRLTLLQAPHRYKDLRTGTIVAHLMEDHGFRAAEWNTVPRWYEEEGIQIDADLAHIATSHFNAFALAFADAHPEGRVVQIHGFERTKRTTEAGRSASAIVSAGVETASDTARAVAACLAARLPSETVLLYPDEVRELGGTTNENGKALRAVGFDRFVHMELSRELRQRLVDEPETRARLAACLSEA